MLLGEMIEGVYYVVTKGLHTRPFLKWDHVSMAGKGILNHTAGGWLPIKEIEPYLSEVEVTVNLVHYVKKFASYQIGIDRFKEVIQESMTKEESEKLFKEFRLAFSFLKTSL